MGNKIGSTPALLEQQLQDMAQWAGDIDYTDIAKFGKRPNDWDKAYKFIIKLDKAGFFEQDLDEDPNQFKDYTKLIKLIKNK